VIQQCISFRVKQDESIIVDAWYGAREREEFFSLDPATTQSTSIRQITEHIIKLSTTQQTHMKNTLNKRARTHTAPNIINTKADTLLLILPICYRTQLEQAAL